MKVLGIDLGTTKAAVIVYDPENGLEMAVNAPHFAALDHKDPGAGEQDAAKIFDCVYSLIGKLPENLRREIKAVGITGQMHSLMLTDGKVFSPLVTWQDHRCGAEMIDRFNRKSSLKLREGFGGTTLARMAEEKVLGQWKKAGNICDVLSWVIRGGKGELITDPTFAASWGIYDTGKGQWDKNALKSLDIPEKILPEIRPSGECAGTISAEFSEKFQIPADAVVINAIGDNQASILGTGSDFAAELYLTLGTGAQLSMVVDENLPDLPDNLELRPFPGNRFLLVSAPLCGGAAFAWLADTVNRFRSELGDEPLPRGELLDKLDDAGFRFMQENGESSIRIAPHFLGERHAPELRGNIAGLTLNNAGPGELASALALGIIRNLKSGFPENQLRSRKKVIGSGNAVRLVKSICLAIEREFKLPLVLTDGSEEAAVGAAKLAVKNSVLSR